MDAFRFLSTNLFLVYNVRIQVTVSTWAIKSAASASKSRASGASLRNRSQPAVDNRTDTA
jgi:hypothetical protein